jgi:hypothetical protein
MLLPFWEDVITNADLGDLHYVVGVRHPMEVAQSQRRRCLADPDSFLLGKDLRYTLALWFKYYQDVIRFANAPLLIVDYNNLVQQPGTELDRIAQFVNVEPALDDLIWFEKNFIDTGLRRNRYQDQSCAVSEAVSLEFAFKLNDLLVSLADRSTVNAQELREHYANVYQGSGVAQVDALIATLVEPAASLRHNKIFRSELIEAKQRLVKIQNSTSWRITAPLRMAMKFAKSLRSKLPH